MILRLLAALLLSTSAAAAGSRSKTPGAAAAKAAPVLAPSAMASASAPAQAAVQVRAAVLPAAAGAFSAAVDLSASVAPADASPEAARIAARLEELRRATPTAPHSIEDVTLDPVPGMSYHPSPSDWRDEVMYSVFLDRFARSADGRPIGDPASGTSRHGGDLKGATEKLDYLKEAGVSTIILSPVTMTVPEAYHYYAPIHFMAVDPNLGNLDHLKTFVAEAHKRGLRVVLDMVINHTGPVFEYEGGPSASGWVGLDAPRKNIGEWTHPLRPIELTHPDRFTRRGVINNWDDPGQALHGDFPPNYRHFSSNDAETQRVLIKIASWWIKETDIDGVRLDAIRHVDPGFLRRFGREVKAYAASLGKDRFLLLGENSTGQDEKLLNDFGVGMDTVYNYPEYRRTMHVLHGRYTPQQGDPAAKRLADSLERSQSVLGEAAGRLVRFIDNHDTYRFLRDGEPLQRLFLALAFLMLSLGIPMIYYGTEQGFRTKTDRLDAEDGKHPADPENRQDMFAEGKFKTESSAGDKFDVTAPTFQFLRKLAELRRKHAALRRGAQYVRFADPSGPGIYAFSRIHEGHEVVVVMNTADEDRAADMFVAGELNGPGTAFMDELDQAWSGASYMSDGGGSKIAVSVPARGVRVLVRKP